MARGRKPGTPRTGGRLKGGLNKRSLVAATIKAAVQGMNIALPKFQAVQELRRIALWFMGAAQLEEAKGAETNRDLVAKHLEAAARILKEIAPYESARKTAVVVKESAIDPTTLSDEELDALERIHRTHAGPATSPGRESETVN